MTLLKKIALGFLGFILFSLIGALPLMLVMEKISSEEGFVSLLEEASGQKLPEQLTQKAGQLYSRTPLPLMHSLIQSSFTPSIILTIIVFVLAAIISRNLKEILGFASYPLIIAGIGLLFFPLVMNLTLESALSGTLPPEALALGVTESLLQGKLFQEIFVLMNFYGLAFLVVGVALKIVQFFIGRKEKQKASIETVKQAETKQEPSENI